MADDFDWTVIEEGPQSDDRDPSPEPSAPTRPASPRWPFIGVATAAVAALAVGLALFWPHDGDTQLRANLAAVAGAELRPVPLPYAIRSQSALAVESVAEDGERLNVTFGFTATLVDGTPLRFRLERVLTAEGGVLKKDAAAVDETLVTITARASNPRIELEAQVVDRDFLEREVAPYLADIGARACAIWSCWGDSSIRLSFTLTDPAAGRTAFEPIGGSWMLAAMSNLYRTAQPVLPPPHVAGVPADPATLEAYRRTLAMRMLPRFANQIAGPVGRPDVGAANDTLVAALAARTSLLLGLEIRAADALSTPPVTTGQLTDPDLSSRDLAQQALWRFNAVFGPTLNPVEKDVWRQISRSDPDVLSAMAEAMAQSGWQPEQALGLLTDSDVVQRAVQRLTGESWSLLVQCQTRSQVLGRDLRPTVGGELPANWQDLDFYPISGDGSFLPMMLAHQPALLDRTTGLAWWLPTASLAGGRASWMSWIDSDTIQIEPLTWEGQPNGIRVHVNRATDGRLTFNTDSGDNTATWNRVPSPDSPYIFEALPDTDMSGNFMRSGLIHESGARVVDYGLAAAPAVNAVTGEFVVLSRDLTTAEYLVTIYSGPTDTVGTVVWRSATEAHLGAGPHKGVVAWETVGHRVLVALEAAQVVSRPENEAGVWIIDPGAARSRRLDWVPGSISPELFWQVAADGRYAALSTPGTVTLVDLAGDQPPRLLSGAADIFWAPHGSALALTMPDGLRIFADPNDVEPRWTTSDTTCSNLIWNPTSAQPAVSGP